MNILLTGGTGLIGNALTRALIDKGYQVRILTRETDVEPPFFTWNAQHINEKVFEDLDGIIHLAGAPLMHKWTKKYKQQIIDSRVNTIKLLHKYICKKNIQLKFFISASGSSFYGQTTSNKIYTEVDSIGNDFLAHVCQQWEDAANLFKTNATKVVCIRTPLVLAKEAESFKLMQFPTALGLGSCLGNGKQWTTWIHLHDLCRIYIEAIENQNLNGAINAVASEQISHQDFMHSLAKALNKPLWLPNIPAFLVRFAMGEKASLILDGSRLSNQKIKNHNFTFKFDSLDKVWDDFFSS